MNPYRGHMHPYYALLELGEDMKHPLAFLREARSTFLTFPRWVQAALVAAGATGVANLVLGIVEILWKL